MAYVKLDKDILTSSLWMDSDVALLFITALLLVEPREFTEPMPELETDQLKETGFVIPSGWYGFVPASGIGLISHAKLPAKRGIKALIMLASPDRQSRSQEYAGRRLVRVNGGFIMLNYVRFREKDHLVVERMRRYRERQKQNPAQPPKEKPLRVRRLTKMQLRAQEGMYFPPETR